MNVPGDYNLTRPACLIGLWQEERALRQENYAARVYGRDINTVDTFERVQPRCRGSNSAQGWQSQTHAAMAQRHAPSTRPAPPPRDTLRQKQIELEATAHVAETLRPREERVQLLSETRAAYAAPPGDATLTAPAAAAARREGRSHWRVDAAAALGVTANPAAYETSDYASEPQVTLFASRLAEACFPASGAIAGAFAAGAAHSAAARHPGFTLPLAEAHKHHEGAVDAQAAGPGSGSESGRAPPTTYRLPLRALVPGSELSIATVFTRFLRRMRDGPGLDARAFVAACAAAAARSASDVAAISARTGGDAAGAVSATGRVGVGSAFAIAPDAGAPAPPTAREASDARLVPADVFRAFVHSLRTPLADADLEAVVRLCDVRGDAQFVSLAAFAQLCAFANP